MSPLGYLPGMAGQFHSAVFNVYSDDSRAKMDAWLTEQSAAGWEPVTAMLVTSRSMQTPQVLVVIRREVD